MHGLFISRSDEIHAGETAGHKYIDRLLIEYFTFSDIARKKKPISWI